MSSIKDKVYKCFLVYSCMGFSLAGAEHYKASFNVAQLIKKNLKTAEETSYSFSSEEGLKPIEKKQNKNSAFSRSTSSEKIETSTIKIKQEIQDTKTTEENKSLSQESTVIYQDTNTKDSLKIETKPSVDTQIPTHSISEDFAPQVKEQVQGAGFLDSLIEDSSWFFQQKKTKHKFGVVPIYSYDRTRGSRLGLRFLLYSSQEKGYYVGVAGSQYVSKPFSRFDISYISDRVQNFRTEASIIYDNHYENYFGEGMDTKLSDLKKLHAHRFVASYKVFYTIPQQHIYTGLGLEFHFREETPESQNNKIYFEKEGFFYFIGLAGYDSRSNWKNPKEGAFHQLSVACKSILDYSNSYCKGEGDLRFYLSLLKDLDLHDQLKNSVLALRAFIGSAFFSKSTYSSAYSLGGQNPFQNFNVLRGFKQNRFRGDKAYFLQAELRMPLSEKYFSGTLFSGLGETAKKNEDFKGFVVNYGAGLLVGFPPSYDMKLRFDFATGKDRNEERNHNFIVSFFHAF